MTHWKSIPKCHSGEWNPPQWLRVFASSQDQKIRSELDTLTAASWTTRDQVIDKPAFSHLYGDLDGPGHAFSHAPLLPFSMHEPQLTQALSNYMANPTTDNDRRRIAAAFVRALLDAASKKIQVSTENAQRFLDSRTEIRPDSIKVIAEHVVTQENRVAGYIDLVVHYETDRGARTIIIENKIDHYIGDGQLQRYAEYAGNEFDSDVLKVVVTRRLSDNDRRQKKVNRGWVFLTWRMVLRALERELSSVEGGYTMIDFHRLRRTMWQDLYHEV